METNQTAKPLTKNLKKKIMSNIVKEAEEMSEFEKMLAKAEEMEMPACSADNPEECEACGS